MKRANILVFAFIFLLVFVSQVKAEDINDNGNDKIIALTNPVKYHVVVSLNIKNEGYVLNRLSVLFPMPQSNLYQEISNVQIADGKILDIPDTTDKYIRYVYNQNLPAIGETNHTTYEFDCTLYNITTDFSKIHEIYPYDTSSIIYKLYTGKKGDIIDPSNPQIQEIGNKIWSQSKDVLDYAKKCYEYVAFNYKYLDPYTGLHPLQELLSAGGGDCGNLSSIYVSLLRYKDIPSRHLVTVRPDGSVHVWADFYLEKYGWIPVDVTSKNGNAKGDYFGKVNVARNGIIFSKGVSLTLNNGLADKKMNLLQTYGYWYWGEAKSGKIIPQYELKSTRL